MSGKFFEPSVSRHGEGWKKIPNEESQSYGREFLMDLLGEKPPRLGIADLTETEQQAQTLLGELLSGDADFYDQYFVDPRTSPLYQSLREESYADESRGVSELRRRSQMGGMFQSSPSYRAEGDYRAEAGRGRSTMLSKLYEQERQRAYAEPYQRLGAVAQYGGLPRQIEQAKYQSAYEQRMMPYTALANIAAQLMNEQRNMWDPGVAWKKESGLTQTINYANSLLGLGQSAGIGGGGGGGGYSSDNLSSIIGELGA